MLTTKQFSWANKTLAAEASDLGLQGWPQQLLVRSDHTGRVEAFRQVRRQTDFEGELMAVHYLGAKTNVQMVVFND